MNNARAVRKAEESFAKLKEILLSDDQRRIAELKEELERLQVRLRDKEQLIQILGPVIAELMEKKIIESRDEMAEVLSPIMSEAIKNQVEYAKDEVVNALYPVIGKTIRKSIAEAMRNLARTVNEKVERALSLRLLVKRIKARVSGVSPEDLILKESMPFEIQEIFLIHKDTGIMLLHASSQSSHSQADKELISGMLTAIQDFAGTVFSGEEARDLHEIQYEDRQIRLEVGQHAYLAFVSSGLPPDDFSEEIADLGSEIHRKFLPALRDFAGNVDVFQSAYPMLVRFLHKHQTALVQDSGIGVVQKRSRKGLVFLLVLPLILLGVYFGVFVIPKKITEKKILADLEPLTKEHTVFADAQVQFRVDGSLVTMSGTVDRRNQKDDIEALVSSRPRVKQVENMIEVMPWPSDPEDLHKEVQKILSEDSLDLSQVKFVFADGRLYMEGVALTDQERSQIRKAVAECTSLPVIVDNIELASTEQRILQEIEGMVLYFSSGQSSLDSQGLDEVRRLLQRLSEVSFERLYVIGHADDIGTDAVNMQLSRRRAEWIRSYLIQNGIQAEKLTVIARGSEQPVGLDQTNEARALNRRVVFAFHLDEQRP